mmetsp:Transcript_6212/g.15373  ORF Transcript_6212/g.15373 Transcript_6212/m.15373 type:complete len:257 (+) Transcript_6212:1319-2089(+)
MVLGELGRRHRERVGEREVDSEKVLQRGQHHEHGRAALHLHKRPIFVVGAVNFVFVDDVGDGTFVIEVDLAAVLALTLEYFSCGAPVVVGDECRAIGLLVVLVVDAVDKRLPDSCHVKLREHLIGEAIVEVPAAKVTERHVLGHLGPREVRFLLLCRVEVLSRQPLGARRQIGLHLIRVARRTKTTRLQPGTNDALQEFVSNLIDDLSTKMLHHRKNEGHFDSLLDPTLALTGPFVVPNALCIGGHRQPHVEDLAG